MMVLVLSPGTSPLASSGRSTASPVFLSLMSGVNLTYGPQLSAPPGAVDWVHIADAMVFECFSYLFLGI